MYLDIYGDRYSIFFFFFNDPATTEIYTLSLHDALPIFDREKLPPIETPGGVIELLGRMADRKSTRLNSSHVAISYAVFCLKNKKLLADTSLSETYHKLQQSRTAVKEPE